MPRAGRRGLARVVVGRRGVDGEDVPGLDVDGDRHRERGVVLLHQMAELGVHDFLELRVEGDLDARDVRAVAVAPEVVGDARPPGPLAVPREVAGAALVDAAFEAVHERRPGAVLKDRLAEMGYLWKMFTVILALYAFYLLESFFAFLGRR